MAISEVAIVGGGIAGCTIARELARKGARVRLLEQQSIAAGASGRNAGLLHAAEGGPDVARMMRASWSVYAELEDGPVNIEKVTLDQLLLATDPQQFEAGKTIARQIAGDSRGFRVDAVEAQELRREYPQLNPDLAGGFLVHDVWMIDPASATRAFAEAARLAGAQVSAGEKVGKIVRRSGRVEGVLTDSGRIAADVVIVATGSRLTDLLPSMPITVGRGWMMRIGGLDFDLPVLEEMSRSWISIEGQGTATRPPALTEVAAGGYDVPTVVAFAYLPKGKGVGIVGTSVARSLKDAVEGVDMPQRIARLALEFVPAFAKAHTEAAWFGERPMTPDGMPIAGPLPEAGLWVHGGHGTFGMLAAPATAAWLAAAIEGEPASPHLAALDPMRFEAAVRA
ncbi:MAG: FAD-binding oxidoreductase [Chloroflexi bacterium]|nr:MAG: FAD-binding oxidoreductase [Chloroflexota bacterium]